MATCRSLALFGNELLVEEGKVRWTAPLFLFTSHRRQTVDAIGGVFHHLAAVATKVSPLGVHICKPSVLTEGIDFFVRRFLALSAYGSSLEMKPNPHSERRSVFQRTTDHCFVQKGPSVPLRNRAHLAKS